MVFEYGAQTPTLIPLPQLPLNLNQTVWEPKSFEMEALGLESCDVVGLGTEVFGVRSEEI